MSQSIPFFDVIYGIHQVIFSVFEPSQACITTVANKILDISRVMIVVGYNFCRYSHNRTFSTNGGVSVKMKLPNRFCATFCRQNARLFLCQRTKLRFLGSLSCGHLGCDRPNRDARVLYVGY